MDFQLDMANIPGMNDNTENLLAYFRNIYDRWIEATKIATEFPLNPLSLEPQNVIVLGTKPTNVAAHIFRDLLWSSFRLPIFPLDSEEDFLPGYVNKKTLIFVLSSGGADTATIEIMQQALAKEAHVIAVSPPGAVITYAQENGTPHLELKESLRYFAASGYLYVILIKLLERFGLLAEKFLEENISDDFFKLNTVFQNTMSSFDSWLKEIVSLLSGKNILVFGNLGTTAGIAMKWVYSLVVRTSQNASWDTLPDLQKQALNSVFLPGDYHALLIRETAEDQRVKQGFKSLTQELTLRGINYTDITGQGVTKYENVASLLYLGDMVSIIIKASKETHSNN